jgi:hypothetical protein
MDGIGMALMVVESARASSKAFDIVAMVNS